MLNAEMLEKRIQQSGLKPSFICDELGISRTVWYNRRHGLSEFTNREMLALKKLLNLSSKEFERIFFAESVH